MIVLFWVILIIMLLLSVWFVVSPLMGFVKLKDTNQNKQNVLITKDQLKELEKEHTDNLLSDSEYQQRKEDLQKALISNVSESGSDEVETVTSKIEFNKLAVLFVLLVISFIAVPTYYFLGNSGLVAANSQQTNVSDGSRHSGTSSGSQMSMAEAVKNLAERMKADPTNIKGWQMLGRSYVSMRRFKEAADVYAHIYKQTGDETNVLLAYADALAMSRNGKISGMPFQLVMTALNQEPNNTTALWLAGLGYAEKGEFNKAIKLWERLLPLFAGNINSQNKVKNLIAKANLKLGLPIVAKHEEQNEPMETAALPSIQVTVSLLDSFKNKVSPSDLVFIYAKASKGPPMPLAAMRKRVSDLPITVQLDDSMAMMPQMKLSSFPMVTVGVRISKSGSPMGKSGDLEGVVENVMVNADARVNIVINSVR